MRVVNLSHGPSLIKLGVLSATLYRRLQGGNLNGRALPHMDWIPVVLSNTMFESPFISTAKCCGLMDRTHGSYDEYFYDGDEPTTEVYNGSEDFRRYGNVFSNAIRVINNYSPLRVLPPSFKREKGVGHFNPEGTLFAGSAGFNQRLTSILGHTDEINNQLVPRTDQWGAYENYATELIRQTTFESPFVVSKGPTVAVPRRQSSVIFNYLEDHISDFDGEYPTDGSGVSGWYTSLTYLSARASDWSFNYRVRDVTQPGHDPENVPGWYAYRSVYDITYTLEAAFSDLSEFEFGDYDLTETMSLVLNMTVDVVSNEYRFDLGPWTSDMPANMPYTHDFTGSEPLVVVTPSKDSDLDTNYQVPYSWSKFIDSEYPGSYLAQPTGFVTAVLNRMPHIRPSASISAGEALDSFLQVIKANHLETLSDLRDIGSLLPRVDLTLKFVRDLKSGNYFGAVEDVLNFLTSTKLLIEFGLDPAASSVMEMVEKADSVKRRLDGADVFGHKELHAKFSYTFPEGEFGYKSSRLITRTKLVASFDSSSIMANLMGGYARGIFPSLSALWDLYPFSFVVDWVTNMDDRIDELDHQFLFLCCRVHYCVHSFKVYTEIDEDRLEEYNLIPQDRNELPSFVYYKREISRFPPSLKESKYDFLRPTGPLDWGTVASLFYQIVRR